MWRYREGGTRRELRTSDPCLCTLHHPSVGHALLLRLHLLLDLHLPARRDPLHDTAETHRDERVKPSLRDN